MAAGVERWLASGAAATQANAVSVDYAGMVPFYMTFGLLSVFGTAAVTFVYLLDSRLHRDHASTMILILTLMDFLYTLKYIIGAVAWLAGERDERDSFHIFQDNCMSSTAYGQFMGMASISWNACWTFDFLCVLSNPLRNTASQRRWYHLFVWTICVATTVFVLAASANENASNHTCWVRADNANSLIFEVPLYVYITLALFSLAYAALRLRRGTRASINVRRALFARHATYVGAFIFVWMWPIIHRFADASDQNYGFTVMDVIAVSGQAFLFACIRLSEPGAWAIFTDLLQRYLWVPIASALAGGTESDRQGIANRYGNHWGPGGDDKDGEEWAPGQPGSGDGRGSPADGGMAAHGYGTTAESDVEGANLLPRGADGEALSSAIGAGGGGPALPGQSPSYPLPGSAAGAPSSSPALSDASSSFRRAAKARRHLWRRLRSLLGGAGRMWRTSSGDELLASSPPPLQPLPAGAGAAFSPGGRGAPTARDGSPVQPTLSPESSAAWRHTGSAREAYSRMPSVGPGRDPRLQMQPPGLALGGRGQSSAEGAPPAQKPVRQWPGAQRHSFAAGGRKPRTGSVDASGDVYLERLPPPAVPGAGHDYLRQVLLDGDAEEAAGSGGDAVVEGARSSPGGPAGLGVPLLSEEEEASPTHGSTVGGRGAAAAAALSGARAIGSAGAYLPPVHRAVPGGPPLRGAGAPDGPPPRRVHRRERSRWEDTPVSLSVPAVTPQSPLATGSSKTYPSSSASEGGEEEDSVASSDSGEGQGGGSSSGAASKAVQPGSGGVVTVLRQRSMSNDDVSPTEESPGPSPATPAALPPAAAGGRAAAARVGHGLSSSGRSEGPPLAGLPALPALRTASSQRMFRGEAARPGTPEHLSSVSGGGGAALPMSPLTAAFHAAGSSSSSSASGRASSGESGRPAPGFIPPAYSRSSSAAAPFPAATPLFQSSGGPGTVPAQGGPRAPGQPQPQQPQQQGPPFLSLSSAGEGGGKPAPPAPATSASLPSVGVPGLSSPTLTAASAGPPGPSRHTHAVDKNSISSSSGTGWDIGAGLRLELGMCMLSALCQSLLEGEAERRVEAAAVAAAAFTASRRQAEAGVPGGRPAPGPREAPASGKPRSPTPEAGADAAIVAALNAAAVTASAAVPSARRDISASLRDTSSVPREFTLLQDFDCEEYLESAMARAATRKGPGSAPAAATGQARSVARVPPSAAAPAPTSMIDSFELVALADTAFAQLRYAAALNVAQVVYSLDPSLLRTGGLRAHFSDGASSSFFCRSTDGTLVVKTISGGEAEELLRLLPAYAGHMLSQPDSLLCRFYGAYALKLPSTTRVYFLLMGNVFPVSDAGPRAETYDLKGSTVGRRARITKSLVSRNDAGQLVPRGMLWQDTEFRERYPRGLPVSDVDVMLRALDTGGAPSSTPARPLGDLAVGMARSRGIVDQLERDVTLLARHGLMDYSLLINVQPITTAQASSPAAGGQPAAGAASTGEGAGAAPAPAPFLQARIESHGSLDTVAVTLTGDLAAVASASSALRSLGASPMPFGTAQGASPSRISPLPSPMGDAHDPHPATEVRLVDALLEVAPPAGADGGGSLSLLLPLPELQEGRPTVTSVVALENQVDGSLTAVDENVAAVLAASSAQRMDEHARSAAAAHLLAGELVSAASAPLGGAVLSSQDHQAASRLGHAAAAPAEGALEGGPPSSSGAGPSALPEVPALLEKLLPPPAAAGGTSSAMTQELIYGVSYKLSFSHSSELLPSDAAMLVRAATSLPAQIAAVGDVLSRHRGGKMTRWSPLAVSAVALGKPSSAATAGGGIGAQGAAHPANGTSAHAPPTPAGTVHPSSSPPALSELAALSSSPSTLGVAFVHAIAADARALFGARPSPDPGGAGSIAAALAGSQPTSAQPGAQLVSAVYSQRAIVQVGIIDCLQTYGYGKRMENTFKTLRYAIGHGPGGSDAEISAVEPNRYAVRFMDFVRRVFLPTVLQASAATAAAAAAVNPAVGWGGGASPGSTAHGAPRAAVSAAPAPSVPGARADGSSDGRASVELEIMVSGTAVPHDAPGASH